MAKFNFKKKFGQNFLRDDNVLQQIANLVEVTEKDLVLEIGPGHGALTKKLKKTGASILCYEIDLETKEVLEKLEDDKCRIIFEDFLKANVLDDISTYQYENLYVIANIPYYITTPIIKKIIELDKVKAMALMVQDEVADRFCAQPGNKEYGELTVYLNYYFRITKAIEVPRTCFYPIPNVDSAVVVFKRKEIKPYLKDETNFFKLISDCFSQKRKNIRNNLRNYDLDKISEILETRGFSLQSRAEELELEDFIDLSNLLSEK